MEYIQFSLKFFDVFTNSKVWSLTWYFLIDGEQYRRERNFTHLIIKALQWLAW